MKDLIIIGAGPAGLTAAIYGIRAGMDILVLEKLAPGGQVMNTYEVENYPGFEEPVQGWELMSAMENQVKRLGVEIASGEVQAIKKIESDKIFSLTLTDGKILESKSVILASGAMHSTLNVPGEAKFSGKGVSYCGTCDGNFFKEKIIAVAGGGNTALEEAIFLTRFGIKVYLIHRRDEFRGAKILQDRLLANPKVEVIYNTVVQEIKGGNMVNALRLKNVKTGEEKDLPVEGFFIFVGYKPNTEYLAEELLDGSKQVIVDKNMQTSIKGQFAAGDMRADSRKQIITACADGAIAALAAYDYLQEM
jgi:thioredoxin reductase (NADPH)